MMEEDNTARNELIKSKGVSIRNPLPKTDWTEYFRIQKEIDRLTIELWDNLLKDVKVPTDIKPWKTLK